VNGVLVWQFDRRKLHRVGGALNYGRATVRCIWELADGYCFHSLMTGRFGAPANQGLSDWIDDAGVPNPLSGTDWLTYNRSTLPAETRAVWEEAIAAFFKTRTKAEIREEGRRRGINATVVNTPADVLSDPHLAERAFLDGAEPTRFVGVTPGPAAAPDKTPAEPKRPGPLAGVRILDFAWALVGSTTTKILGDLGADVIKVESRGRPCLTRIDVQVQASRADSFDDKPWYAHLNTSKRSLALDMKKPASRELLNPLIQWADVVVENFSPGTMAKLGLDYAALARINPGLVMVSGSVYGQTGPMAQEWGVDGTGGALSGRTYLTGFPDRPPVIPGAVPYGDVIVPYAMAAAVAAALESRRTTGRGSHIDASMYEICVQQMRDALLAAGRGEAVERLGNADPRVRHQGVYPVAGEDRWIAISLFDEADVARFEQLAGVPAEDAAIAAWTAPQEERALAERLQSAGLAAAVVQDVEDLVERDPQIAARGTLVPLDHPLLGRFGHLRTPIGFSRTIPQPYRAPSIGEHVEEVARDIAGLSPDRIAALAADGVFR
jgi:crotonobetainyl-CoA:carnitine CoA-transferase CaiB-like acyl-CoA transferase